MSDESNIGRRDFLKTTPLMLGGLGALAASAAHGNSPPVNPPVTAQDVIDRIMADAGVEPIEGTIDTIKVGNASNPVHGIVTTFMATTAVIQKAIEHNADFIITHEPTFYSHRDNTDWLEDDRVYRYKRALLDDHGITVWRYHDHIHKITPDPIVTGLAARLGWLDMLDAADPLICHIPPMKLGDLAQHCKQRLDMKAMNFVGDSDMPCKAVGLLPGAWGGKHQIGFLSEGKIDVLICGEVAEWETNEYVRDSQHTDRPLGLIVTGHQCSEEDGMRTLAEWLSAELPDVPVHHVSAGDPFTYI